MKNNNRGQSIVEITLLTPLVMIALYIPIDFGMMYHTAHRVQNAVRESARMAASTDPFSQSAMNADLDSRLTSYTVSSRSVNLYQTSPANCTKVVTATATISYPFFFYRMMRWFGVNIPATQAITRSTTLRSQFQPITNAGGACTA
jgi:Flp pilus assembly protein TadG